MKRKEPDISLTASRFSAIIGMDRNEILKRLEEAKAESVGKKNGGELYGLKDLFRAAIGGDIMEQRLRKLRAESAKLEHDLAVKRREFVPVSESVETVLQCGHDIRAAITSLPIEHAEQDKLLRIMQKVAEVWQARADAEKRMVETIV